MDADEFRVSREQIETLLREASQWIARRSIVESSSKLGEAERLLVSLGNRAAGDIQEGSVQRLRVEHERLSRKIDGTLSAREAGKSEDGNIALKCNWNDRKYGAPCSQEAYEFNVSERRRWCCAPENQCRKCGDVVTLANYPCYESIALKEMFFGAGWDLTGGKDHFRQIKSVRAGKIAVLTTRPPGAREEDRLIVGCLLVARVVDDPDKETMIYGDREKSIEVEYDAVRVKFWDYYRNPNAGDLVVWASGLFRYVSDGTAIGILRGIEETYRLAGKDTSRVTRLLRTIQGGADT